MTPQFALDPFDPHVIWFKAWRGHIANARLGDETSRYYQQAACIANVMYVTELALKIGRLKKAGIIKEIDYGI